ncbi:MAG: alginate export family protein [Fuerstiella sp.]
MTASALPPSVGRHAGLSGWDQTPLAAQQRYRSPFETGAIEPGPWRPSLFVDAAQPLLSQPDSGTHSFAYGHVDVPNGLPSGERQYQLAGPGHSLSPPMQMYGTSPDLYVPPTGHAAEAAINYAPTPPEAYLQPNSELSYSSPYLQPQTGQSHGVVAADSCGSVGVCAEGCRDAASSCATLSPSWIPDELLPMMKNQQRGGLRSSFGGELRYRFMDESNRLRPPGPGNSNYNLWRFTPYISITAAERVTVFAQGIDASAFGYDAPYSPVGIDVNRSDLLRAYVELKITDRLSYRYGRQFLSYGSQRLLSPLAWGNTYRNFEGHKVRFEGDDWDVDLFTMNSVNAAAGNVFRPTGFDTPNADRRISGAYTSYKGLKNSTVDLYWMWLDNQNDDPAQHDGNRHTVGMRWAGKLPVMECQQNSPFWSWDVEGAYQFGRDDFGTGRNLTVNAGFVAMETGYTASDLPWSPSFASIFHWGSGDNNPNDGQDNTVSTLYPLGHSYWGLIDNLNGQNLIDYGLRGGFKPTERLSFSTTVHCFDRASQNDSVYNVAGVQYATGAPGRNIGVESDFVGTWDVSKAFQVQVGYSWFGYGTAIDNSSPRDDAEQFWVMSTLRF